MSDKIQQFNQKQTKNITANINSGDTVRVYQAIGKDEKTQKEKIQAFEGIVISRKHGSEPGGTIKVRKTIDGIGVERTFPLHSPAINQIEIIKRGKTRRSKLYYLRQAKGKRARLKTEVADEKMFQVPQEQISSEPKPETQETEQKEEKTEEEIK